MRMNRWRCVCAQVLGLLVLGLLVLGLPLALLTGLLGDHRPGSLG